MVESSSRDSIELREIGVDDKRVDEVAKAAEADPSAGGNPIKVGASELGKSFVAAALAQLKARGRVDHPFIGVLGRSITDRIAKQFQLPVKRGVLVERVTPGSGAEKAGLLGGTTQIVVAGETYEVGGDLIVKAGGQDVTSTELLREIVSQHKTGDTLSIEYYRGSELRTAAVTLGRPTPPPQE